MAYVDDARSFIKDLLHLDGDHFGYPLIEANAAPLALYYLQKAKNMKPANYKKRSVMWKILWILKELFSSLWSIGKIGDDDRSNCDYLFICNVTRHYDVLLPIIDKMIIEDNNVSIIVLCRFPFKNLPIDYNPNVLYLDWGQVKGFRYIKNLIIKLFKVARPVVKPSLLTSAFYQWYDMNVFKSLRAICIGEAATKLFSPKKIIVTDVSDFEAKSITLMGKKLGIPSLCIQYGMLGPLDTEWTFFSQDAVATFDLTSAKVLKEHGVTPEKIYITGNPRFDQYKPDMIQREKTRKRLGVDKNTPLVLFVSIPSAPDGIGVIESSITQNEYKDILKAIYLLPNVLTTHQLVVRPHPEEDISLHNPFLQDNSEKVIFDAKNSIVDILNTADLVITLHSTVGYEAIILDKPLILLNFNNRESSVDFAQRGVAIEVKKESELVSNIESVLSNPTLRKKLTSARKRYRKEMGIEPHESIHRCVKLLISIVV